MVANVVHDAFEKLKELNGLSQRAAAKRLGVGKSTVGRWRKKKRPPREKRKKVTIDSLGLQKNRNKYAPRCGCEAALITLDGYCPECKLMELAKQGQVVIDG